MATYDHPITGVSLNRIDIERPALSFFEAVTAHLMRRQGERYHIIAQKLGTNPARLGEVFRGVRHPKAEAEALKLLRRIPKATRQALLGI